MKKCQQCGKIYDNTWKICMHDNTSLVEFTSEEEVKIKNFLVSTTFTIEGRKIKAYLGIVSGVAVLGFGILREFLAGVTDTFGGESGSYQKEILSAKNSALNKLINDAVALSANAVVGVKLDFEQISSQGTSFIMVTATGTAVQLEE